MLINTTESMRAMPDESSEVGAANADVNTAPSILDEDGEVEFPDNDDHSPRVYSVTMKQLPNSEHVDCTVSYAAPDGPHTKRKIFTRPVTAWILAEALIDLDSW